MAEQPTSWTIDADPPNEKPAAKPKRKIPRPSEKTFVERLKEKYCGEQATRGHGYVIVFHGKPKSDDGAELGYLKNVCLTDSNIRSFGLEGLTLRDLCPNVVDLDLSGNQLESWAEILPALSQLDNLTFLNLARNKLTKDKDCIHSWTDRLPNVENLVLNTTSARWKEVLALSRLLPNLRELHVCGNEMSMLPAEDLHGLESVECLRLNDNKIKNWEEIWKLRHLPNLKSLILSGNPLLDIFYKTFAKSNVAVCDNDSQSNKPDVDGTSTDDVGKATNCDNKNNQINEPVLKASENVINADDKTDECDNSETDGRKADAGDQMSLADADDKTNKRDNNKTYKSQADAGKMVSLADSGDKTKEFYDDGKTNQPKDENETTSKSGTLSDVITKGTDTVKNTEEGESAKNAPDDCNIGKSKPLEQGDIVDGGAVSNLEKKDINDIAGCTVEDPHSMHKGQIEESEIEATEGAKSAEYNTADKIDEATNSEMLQVDHNIDRAEPVLSDIAEIEKAELDTVSDMSRLPGKPFMNLQSLCVSDTQIGKWKHLSALREFPALKSVRVKNVKLASSHSQEDRRKLFVACLPNIAQLNGSEVTASERDKAERHLLRYFSDKKHKPDIYPSLVKRHGQLEPLVDIDISKGYQENVTLTFVNNSEVKFTETVSVRLTVCNLKAMIAERMQLTVGYRCLKLYHNYTSPDHRDIDCSFEELTESASLPLSRFDVKHGDEIHYDVLELPQPQASYWLQSH